MKQIPSMTPARMTPTLQIWPHKPHMNWSLLLSVFILHEICTQNCPPLAQRDCFWPTAGPLHMLFP